MWEQRLSTLRAKQLLCYQYRYSRCKCVLGAGEPLQAMAPRKHAQSADLGRPEPSFCSNPLSFIFFFWYNRVLLAVGGALPALHIAAGRLS